MKNVNKVAFGENLLEGLKTGDRELIDELKVTHGTEKPIVINSQAEWNDLISHAYWDVDWATFDYDAYYQAESEYSQLWQEWYSNGQQGEQPRYPDYLDFGVKIERFYYELGNKKVVVKCDLVLDNTETLQLYNTEITFEGTLSAPESNIQAIWGDSYNTKINGEINVRGFSRPFISGINNLNINLLWGGISFPIFGKVNHNSQQVTATVLLRTSSAFVSSCNNVKIRGDYSSIFYSANACLLSSCTDCEISNMQFRGGMATNCTHIKLTNCTSHSWSVYKNSSYIRNCNDVELASTTFNCADAYEETDTQGGNNDVIGVEGCNGIVTTNAGGCATRTFVNCSRITSRISSFGTIDTNATKVMFDTCADIRHEDTSTPSISGTNTNFVYFKDCSFVTFARIRSAVNTRIIRWQGVNTNVNTDNCIPNDNGTYGNPGSSLPISTPITSSQIAIVSMKLRNFTTKSGIVSQDINISKIAYANGVWVIACSITGTSWDTGMYVSFNNGDSWSEVIHPETGSNRFGAYASGLCCGKGIFLGGYSSNGTTTYIRSTDGINWTAHPFPETLVNRGFTYLREIGKFMLHTTHGSSNRYYLSEDGIDWTRIDMTSTVGLDFVDYGNGTWVASNSSINTVYHTSQDGINWTQRDTPVNNANCIMFGKGVFISGYPTSFSSDTGLICRSTDGINWTTLNDLGRVHSMRYFDEFGIFIGTKANLLVISPDGINWEEIPYSGAGSIYGMHGANGKLIMGAAAWTRNIVVADADEIAGVKGNNIQSKAITLDKLGDDVVELMKGEEIRIVNVDLQPNEEMELLGVDDIGVYTIYTATGNNGRLELQPRLPTGTSTYTTNSRGFSIAYNSTSPEIESHVPIGAWYLMNIAGYNVSTLSKIMFGTNSQRIMMHFQDDSKLAVWGVTSQMQKMRVVLRCNTNPVSGQIFIKKQL